MGDTCCAQVDGNGQHRSGAAQDGGDPAAQDEVVPAESVRVRNPAGNLILSLGRDEAAGMTVGVLRARVGDSVGRCVEEIKLIALMKLLEEDADTLEAFIAQSEPLEILTITSQLPEFDHDKPMLDQLSTLKAMLMSLSAEHQMEAAQVFRKALSDMDGPPPIDAIIQTGVVLRLISICEEGRSNELVHEALWALTNMASGTTEQCQVLMDSRALPTFIALLATPNDDIFEQTVWAIGNIAGDTPANRDMAREAGAAKAICDNLDTTPARQQNPSLQRNATWALRNFCRGGGAGARPDAAGIAPVLSTLRAKLDHQDQEILSDACWALAYLADGPSECIQVVLDLGVCPRLVEIMREPAVAQPALRCVAHFAAGDEGQRQAILDCGALGSVELLLSHRRLAVRKEACWLLSRLTEGTRQQAQAVIGGGLLPKLCSKLGAGEEHRDVKYEAAWAIANASAQRDGEVGRQLIEQGCLEAMCGLLGEAGDDDDDGGCSPKLAKLVLVFAENLLGAGAGEESRNGVAELVGSALSAKQLRKLAGLAADGDGGSVAEKAAALLGKLHPGSVPGG